MKLVQGPLDPDGAGDEANVTALEAEDLAPAERAPGGHDDGGTRCSGRQFDTIISLARRKLWTKYCLNDRLNCVEGLPQGTLDVEPLGHESR